MASTELIKASDGSGNANVATVQSSRAPLSSTIVVDTVLGINPAGFAGTMGTPHTFTDPITSETITVISEATAVDFTGHIDGSDIEIDTIAPGYTDAGSEIGDIVIIRPTTQYADNLAETLEVSHNTDGTVKDAVVTPETLVAGTGTSWPWVSWTPTLANLTLGDGTVTAYYKQTGKTVEFRFEFTLGSTSAVGANPSITLPVTARTTGLTVGRAQNQLFNGSAYDSSASGGYSLTGSVLTSTTAGWSVVNTTFTYAANQNLTASVPITWATGDILALYGSYEVA